MVAFEIDAFWRSSYKYRNAVMRILAGSIDNFFDLHFANATGVFRIILLGRSVPLENTVAIILTNSNISYSSTG